MDFKTLKEETASDCEQVAEQLKKLAAEVREGNISAFLEYFYKDGTEEGDAKIFAVRETLLLRYYHRQEKLDAESEEELQAEKEPQE